MSVAFSMAGVLGRGVEEDAAKETAGAGLACTPGVGGGGGRGKRQREGGHLRAEERGCRESPRLPAPSSWTPCLPNREGIGVRRASRAVCGLRMWQAGPTDTVLWGRAA